MKRLLPFVVFFSVFFFLLFHFTGKVYADNCCGSGYKCNTSCTYKTEVELWMCTVGGDCVPESGGIDQPSTADPTIIGGIPVTPPPAPAPGTTPAPDPCLGTAPTCADITCDGSTKINLPGCPVGGCPATSCCERTSCTSGAYCQVPGWACGGTDACLASGGHWHHICGATDNAGNHVDCDLGEGRGVDGAACTCVNPGAIWNDCQFDADTTPPTCNTLALLSLDKNTPYISPTSTSRSYTNHLQCSSDGTPECNRDAYCSFCGGDGCGNCSTGGGADNGNWTPNCVNEPTVYGDRAYSVIEGASSLQVSTSDTGVDISCPAGCNLRDGKCTDPEDGRLCGNFCTSKTNSTKVGYPSNPGLLYTYNFAGTKPDGMAFKFTADSGLRWSIYQDGTKIYDGGSGSGKIGGLDLTGASTVGIGVEGCCGTVNITDITFFRLQRDAVGQIDNNCPTSGTKTVVRFGVGDTGGVRNVILANPTDASATRFSSVSWGRETNSANSCQISDTAWANYTPYYLWDWCPATREVGARFEDGRGNQNATVECAAMCPCEGCPEVLSALPPGDLCTIASGGVDGWSIDPANQTVVFRADFLANQDPAVGEETAINLAQFNLATTGSLYSTWPLRVFYATKWNVAGKPAHSFFALNKADNNWVTGTTTSHTNDAGVIDQRYLTSNIETSTYTILGGTYGSDRTRVVYNNSNYLTVFFVVKFKNTFPAGTYSEYLYVSNLNGQEDESFHTGLVGWVARYTENTYDFHQFGNFKERQCTGNLQVNVYTVDSNTGDTGNCADTATAYTAGGTYNIKDSLLVTQASGAIPASGQFTASSLTVGNYTSNLVPVAGWRIAECLGPIGLIQTADTLAQPVSIVQDQTKILNYYLINKTDSWFQVKGGDVHAETSIRSYIPSSFLPASRYFNLDLDNYPGLISYGTDYDFWVSGFDPLYNIDGPEYSSSKRWLANSLFVPGKTKYQRFYEKLGSPTTDNFNGTLPALNDGTNIFYSADSVLIEGNNSWNIPTGKKAIFLINGNLDLSLNSRKQITVEKGGFLAFIASGDININQTMGSKRTIDANAETPSLEGIYYAEGSIKTQSDNNDNNGLGAGKMIIGSGVFYGKAGFTLERTLKDDCSDPANVCNLNYPSEYFIFRPDLVVNAPYELWFSDMSWVEVVP